MDRLTLRNRLATLAIGHTADQLTNKGFTYVLVPFLMIKFGIVLGTALNLILSFLLCLMIMKFYDWAKVDWLGIEILKEVREESQKKNIFSKVLSWALKRGDWAVMLVLSVWKDAFICTVWMRKGANQYNGMSRRDWRIFIATLLLSTFWESLWVNMGIATIKKVWSIVF